MGNKYLKLFTNIKKVKSSKKLQDFTRLIYQSKDILIRQDLNHYYLLIIND